MTDSKINDVNFPSSDDGPRDVDAVAAVRGFLCRQFLLFGAIGLFNLVLYVTLYNLLRAVGLPSLAANAITLLVTVASGYLLNKRVFGGHRRQGIIGELTRFLVTYAGTAGVSSAALILLFWIDPGAQKGVENAVAIGANAGLFVVRFVLLRVWVFR